MAFGFRKVFFRVKKTLLAHLALLGVQIIYGANHIVAKEATPEYLLPFGFIVLRVLPSACVFWIIHHFFINESIEKEDIPRIIFCGIFGNALNQLLFFKGLSMTAPINSSIIMITLPIMVLLFSALLLKERLSLAKVFGILLGAMGAFLIIAKGQDSVYVTGKYWGDIFIAINAACFALFLVVVKPLLAKYHPLTVLKWCALVGCFVVVPVGLPELAQTNWASIPPQVWLAILYVIVFTSILAYLLNFFALGKLKASTVGAYVYGQPVIATLIAVGLGKDQLDGVKLIAAGLIFIGVYLVSRQMEDASADQK